MNLTLQHIQRRAFPNTGCMSPIETASFNVGMTMICTCIINWRRKIEDKANIVSVSSFEQVPGAITSSSKSEATSRDLRHFTRLSSDHGAQAFNRP